MDRKTARALDRWLLNPPELEDEEEDPNADCKHPGRRGCGACSACQAWGDAEYDRRRDKELEDDDGKKSAGI